MKTFFERNTPSRQFLDFHNTIISGKLTSGISINRTKRSTSIPIVHRHFYENKHWITTSITIQDAHMRKVLSEVLNKYQDLDMELENWTFEPPFMPLVHRWEVLKNFQSTTNEGPLKSAASALLAFLSPIIASSVFSHSQTKKTGKVRY